MKTLQTVLRLTWYAALFLLYIYALNWCFGLIVERDNASFTAGYLGLTALTVLGGVIVWSYGYRLARWINTRTLSVVGLISLSLWSVGCTTIAPGHVGILVNSWGKNRGVQDYTVTTGQVLYNPFTTSVFEWPTFVQSVVWTKSPTEGHPTNEEITFTNKDQMQVAADVSLAYHLDATKVPEFYVKFRTADMDTFTHGYLRSLTRDKFNEIAGRYTISQIMGDNGPFLKEVKDALQQDLTPFGVILESQFGIIGAPRPPDSVVAAINQQAVAQRLALTKENELRQVNADVAKTVAKATGDAQAKNIWADAEATANRKIAESLSSNLVQYKALEKWNGTLPQVSGGATPFINLQK